MKEQNSCQLGVAGGSPWKLPRPVSFAQGRACPRIRAEATIVVKQTNAAAQNLTGASVKQIVACLFDQSTLRFGDAKAEVVDASLPYARAREQFNAMTMDDFIVSLSTYNGGVPKRIRDIADADVWAAAMAQNALVTLVVEFSRAFEVARLGHDAYAYCPGMTQMRQIQWEGTRSAMFEATGNFVQNAAADVLFLTDDVEVSDDRWAAVVRLYLNEEAGRLSHGPSAPIGLIALWEYTSVGAATALTIHTLGREADSPITDTVNAKRVVKDALYTDPIGASDLNLIATVLHNLPGDGEKHDIPVGAGFFLSQTGSELAPIKAAWLHIPVRTEEEVDLYVGANIANALGVKAINAAAKSGSSLSSGPAALEPVILAQRGEADFEALPGRTFALGVAPSTHIPSHVLAQAHGAVGAAGGTEGKAAAAEKMGKILAKAVPGWLSGRRGKKSVPQAALRMRMLGK